MTDHTPGSNSSYHKEPREMKLEYKTEKDLDSSSHPKEEVKEEYSISNGPRKSNTLYLIISSTSDTSHRDSQELRDDAQRSKRAVPLLIERSRLPAERNSMIWEQAPLEPKVVRIGIVPTERTIGHWQYCYDDLIQIDEESMLLKRNHILKTPSSLQVHGVFWEQKRPCGEAEDGYVSINRIYVKWEIDTVWLDYNLSVAWRDNEMDPSDILITRMPAYEKVRRLAIPAEFIEWPCDMRASDTGLAIADLPDLEDLALLVPTKETVWSDSILVPTVPNTTSFSYLDKFDCESFGSGFEFFIDEDEYEIIFENFDMTGYIRDIYTWEWPDAQYMKVSTIEREKVKVNAKALLGVLSAEVYEVDDEDTNGRRRGVNNFWDVMILSRNLR
ncbi:uncharacterized protein Bfra_004587 [Botrytis fragariae]|uniref:Uncharacterized protein n=1 Tax=Botrytis fragariae TaxID=1964551 RepID=A0A8H6EJI3_9HELO|nr:uncharacterized protein Bfra_004587 [Botrytis fragariae]KAF5874576.1 hypothetical protein Bfra_004587 [Botrytis fragariae]